MSTIVEASIAQGSGKNQQEQLEFGITSEAGGESALSSSPLPANTHNDMRSAYCNMEFAF